MRKLYLLTDYRGCFGHKTRAVPHGSGMDIEALTKHFAAGGYELEPVGLPDVDLGRTNYAGQYVLAGSVQDAECLYKSYVEDVCLALELQGAVVIPEFKYLRAHHNKVFMELLRDLSRLAALKNIRARHFGTREELLARSHLCAGRQVIKAADGAGSRRVRLGADPAQLARHATRLGRSRNIPAELWDLGRALKYQGYAKESRFRRKFIVQSFVEGLSHDWKILVFGDKYYVLYRGARAHDFRASGSGKFEFREDLPEGMLDFAAQVFESFVTPCLSLDVAFDGREFYLLEFQCVHFGTTALEDAPFFFVKSASGWVRQRGPSVLEKEYATSVIRYIRQREAEIPNSKHQIPNSKQIPNPKSQ